MQTSNTPHTVAYNPLAKPPITNATSTTARSNLKAETTIHIRRSVGGKGPKPSHFTTQTFVDTKTPSSAFVPHLHYITHQDCVTLLEALDFIITHALLFIHCAGTKAWISIMRMERPIAHPALLLKASLIPKQLRTSLLQGLPLNLKLRSTPQGRRETKG